MSTTSNNGGHQAEYGPGCKVEFDFKGKVVLITGATRGLGRAMAQGFAHAGAELIISSRKQESCDQVASELEALGVTVHPIACNVGDWGALNNLVRQAYEKTGRIDVLINNAGMAPLYDSLSAVTEELFDKVIAVNLRGPFRLCALIGERMVEQGSGSIINISSQNSWRPNRYAAPYGIAKAGLNNLTEAFAEALGPNVRVNTLVPGPFLTDISKAWDMDAANNRFETMIAQQRAGRPEEIVGAALYLASDYASYTNGAMLKIDGGWGMRYFTGK